MYNDKQVKNFTNNVEKIIVNNVLLVSKSSINYPKADIDYPDLSLKNFQKIFKIVFNVLIGKN